MLYYPSIFLLKAFQLNFFAHIASPHGQKQIEIVVCTLEHPYK